MQTLENNIPLDNWLNKSPSEFEEEIREGLVNIGIEHVTFVINSKDKKPVFKYIEGLGNRISISKRVIEKLERYLSLVTNNEKSKLHFQNDKIMENRIFDHDKLSIIDHNLNKCSLLDDLSYNYKIILIFHSINTLKHEDRRQLELICDIVTAWANYWVAHHVLLLHWYRYAEPCNPSAPSILTKSELDVLELIVKGLTGSEVAKIRRVSKETVRTQIKSILNKTECRNQNQLISRFGQNQWHMSQTMCSNQT